MNFLLMTLVFILGLFLLISGGHLQSRVASKIFFIFGAFNVVLAMYIAWPK
ncbi:hypothetical protein LCR01_17210 [Companilactobacillus crustorum]|uniref:Uncharacterized protein n=1 Tax=Companilactobacillus crustorum TaxID=392416 RepID=A0AB34AD92_9LACO|nr:hypothetical protein LCR01_17210 [Companilactobacillus crustorum]